MEKSLKEIVLDQANAGNVVINTVEGLMLSKIEDLVNQPVDGLLYDLNRDKLTILAMIENSEFDHKWINDYACMQVIVYLKNKNDEATETIQNLLNNQQGLLDALIDLMKGVERLPVHSATEGVLERQYKQAENAIKKAIL